MKQYKSRGIICINDECNIRYEVCELEYKLSEDDSFCYRFTPNYNVIDLLNTDLFQGIPGIDLSLRKAKYERTFLPTFLSERVPSKNREDYFDLLEKVNMSFMDPILYLIKTKEKYSGDNLYLIEYKKKQTIQFKKVISKNNTIGKIKIILDTLASGNNLELGDFTINNENRQTIFPVLKILYEKGLKDMLLKKEKGIELAKKNNKYKGRKPIQVDILQCREMIEKANKKEITNKQAAEILGISIDKYYRVKKEMQKQNDTLKQ